ncbi:DUF6191 domain-containing protein [Streptomyces sp. CAU 1734]|uniref:DUF6191 domain-containing protein n=1 Tax=Streptomyces sp. CAU 1734 TaxID=3140360 RepID=UPI003261B471
MFGAFEEIFSPGQKHTSDERNRLALTRTDVVAGDPCRGPIDLSSGQAVIRRPVEAVAEADTGGGED